MRRPIRNARSLTGSPSNVVFGSLREVTAVTCCVHVFHQADDVSKSMNPHEAAKKEAGETSQERAKQIASQWIKDDSPAPELSPAPTPDPQVDTWTKPSPALTSCVRVIG